MKWEGNCVKYGIGVGEWFTAQQLQPYKEQETMNSDKTIPPYMDYDIKTEETMEMITGGEVHNDICRVIKTNTGKHEIIADKDYEIIEENGKYYAVKKKPKYPQTYEECCDILEAWADMNIACYKARLMNNMQQLLICRDAYWKIAKDWKPTWNTPEEQYCIVNIDNKVVYYPATTLGKILTFPTKEMRDAFYENFKDLIEQCKELW